MKLNPSLRSRINVVYNRRYHLRFRKESDQKSFKIDKKKNLKIIGGPNKAQSSLRELLSFFAIRC